MEIILENKDKTGRFHTPDDLAEIVFETQEPVITILHTNVDSSLKGQGVGNQLVAAVINYARENNYQVKPLCTFAHAVIQRKTEYQDVLLPDKI